MSKVSQIWPFKSKASLIFGPILLISGYEYVSKVDKVSLDQFWFPLTGFWVNK